jgi:uncharacterized repeat protein (TIGR03803 family)
MNNKMFGLAVMITALATAGLPAQTFSVIHTFTNSPDGANPAADLTLYGNTLYGTTQGGGWGSSNSVGGTVFKVNTDGTGYTVIQRFPVVNASWPANITGDLNTGVVLGGDTLYGTTYFDGGTLFKVNTDGTGYATLYTCLGNYYTNLGGLTEMSYPQGDLLLNGGTLYGCLYLGTGYGGWESGVIFSLATDGYDFTNIKNFSWLDESGGYAPFGVLLTNGTLYSVTQRGPGYLNNGTIYKVNTDGTGYVLLKVFAGNDGAIPRSTLVLNGGTLYGTTTAGGANGSGVVFSINTDGTGYTVLKNFSALVSNANSDGANPNSLILSGSTLYGTTVYGGNATNGVVFKINTDGSGFKVIKTFSALNNNTNSDGANPCACLTLGGGTLYGTTCNGGAAGCGTVFQIASTAPGITSQPVHATVSTGGTATFTAGVSGSLPFRYQWMFNGTNISGATNAVLSIAKVTVTNLGFYTVMVTNTIGGVMSAPAGLFIADPKVIAGLIVTGPAGTNYNLQSTAVLGTGSVWTTLTNISLPAQPWLYMDYCSLTNPLQFYRLAITNAAAHPTNAWGNLATLALQQFTALAVQWPAGTNYDLQSAPTWGGVANWTTLTNVGPFPQPFLYIDYSSPTNPQSYRVVPGPAFSSQPASATAASGGMVVFDAGVSGTPPYGFQWIFNGTNIPGATNLSLTITNVSPASAGLYALEIINGGDSVISAAASLAAVDLETLAGLVISGSIGMNYALQSVATLDGGDQWMTLTNILLPSQPYTCIDYGSMTNPRQFYRLAATNAATPPPLNLELLRGLVINGPIGVNYDVQAFTYGGGWTTLTNINLPSQPYIFIDYSSPTNPQQSYRAVPQ